MASSTPGVKGMKDARMDLLPFDALWQVALVYGMGSRKYEDRNWEKGYEYSKSFSALQRHLALFWQGEEFDEESGLPHVAHAAWHALALLSFQLRGTGTDDRPAPNYDPARSGLRSMSASLTNPEIFAHLAGSGS